MAEFTASGLHELFPGADRLPQSVQDAMLSAEGQIVADAQVAEGMRMGVCDTGDTLRSIKVGKPTSHKDGVRSLLVSPQGKNAKGTLNSEVAFVNEYGTRKQKPRPFIRTANEAAADAAVEAAADIFMAYTEKNI